MTDPIQPAEPIDELLDRAIAAANRGDVAIAHHLAEKVLVADASNPDAAALLDAGVASGGELRRLSLLFCDLVGSTELSARHEPELYRTLMSRYKAVCREVIERRYRGHISHVSGDGLLAVFGLPTAHENDAERAVRAGLDIVRELRVLSAEVEAAVGERLEARAAVHHGLVYVDVDEDEVYGLAANVVARYQALAAPGTVIISDDVRAVVGPLFESIAEPARHAKGVDAPLQPYRVLAERPEEPSRGRRWATPLVNRSDELARLRELWREVCDGTGARPRVVHLVGEAGIGKSRLAAVVADEAQAEHAGSLYLLGSPFHADASFYALRAFIEARCGFRRDTLPTERLARLRRDVTAVGLLPGELLPSLAAILTIPPEAGYRALQADAQKLHEAIVAAAARYLLASLGSGPALLLVEDVHWCDKSTLEVIARVLRADRGDLLVVVTSRDAPSSALGRVDTISLGPLDDASGSELVRSLDPGLNDALCREVVNRSDGVPLFLEELVRGIGALGDKPLDVPQVRPASPITLGTRSEPAMQLSGPPGPVPEALYEPLVARLHATGSGLSVAAAAAVIGRDVEHRLLAQVVDLSDSEIDAALRALLGGLILERALDDGRSYRFRHELLRVVAYDLQPLSRRRALHGRVADVLTRGSNEPSTVDWRLVASHYDAAGRSAKAMSAYKRAADGARRLGALHEARAHLTRAIELVADLPNSPERSSREVGLRLRRGFLAASAEGNSSPEAVQDYERCLEIALGNDESDDMFTTLIPLWGYYMVRGDLDRARQITEMLQPALTRGRDFYGPDSEAALGTIHWFAGDFAAAHQHLTGAVAGIVTRPTSPNYAATYFMPFDAPASAHANLALARFMRGDVRGADEQTEAARHRCDAIEFPMGPFTAAYAQFCAWWTLVERGDLAGAASAAAAVADIAQRHGFQFWTLMAASQRAMTDALSAIDTRYQDTAALAAHAEAVDGLCATWQMLDLGLFLPFATATAGRLRAAAGDAAGGNARYREALDIANAKGLHFYDAEVMRLQAQLGIGGETRAHLRQALELARMQGAVPLELRIARNLLAGDDTDALIFLDAAAAQFAIDAHYPELDDARTVLAAAG
jgi:class 3 adenylate cyclase/tetratricopeptide (TPR) repeat protein